MYQSDNSYQSHQLTISYTQKTTESATENPTIESNGAMVEAIVDTYDNTTGWTKTVDSQIGWHWKIHFQTDDWKFRSDTDSRLILTIHTNTEFSSGDDTDLLVSFSQARSKYITTLIRVDNVGGNKIYPFCGNKFASGDIDQLINENNGRRDVKLTKGEGFNRIDPRTNSSSCCENSNPMTFRILNDPRNNQSSYCYYVHGQIYQCCQFEEVWSSNNTMEIFISGDSNGETINIELEIKMQYLESNATTLLPSCMT